MEYERGKYKEIFYYFVCWVWCAGVLVYVCVYVRTLDCLNLYKIPFLIVGFVCKADSQVCFRINIFAEEL